MRVLVDTNVYIELFLKRENYQSVFKFFYLAALNKNQTCLTSMSLRDIGYIIHRSVHNESVSKQLQSEAYSMTSKVINTTADAAIDSLYSDMTDFEDSMQSRAAKEAMCDAIISFNKKDFKSSNLPVFTPMEICEIWSKENA